VTADFAAARVMATDPTAACMGKGEEGVAQLSEEGEVRRRRRQQLTWNIEREGEGARVRIRLIPWYKVKMDPLLSIVYELHI
jgi:hypothetical protein